MWSWPPASTATVPVARLARWAAPSMPRASPETTAKPAAPRSRASRSAKRRPAADALRAPTSATVGRLSAAALPRTAKSGGGAPGQGGGGIVDHLRAGGIVGSAEGDEARAEGLRRLELALRSLARGDGGGTLGAAAAGKMGKRRQRGARTAVMIDERAEG